MLPSINQRKQHHISFSMTILFQAPILYEVKKKKKKKKKK